MAFRLTAMITLVSGTMFIMWLGEQITERGIGNGISIIIFVRIVACLPRAIGTSVEMANSGGFGAAGPLHSYCFSCW